MTNTKEQERRKTLQNFIDYILENVDDYQSDEVQKRLNEIERLYWEAFDNHND